MDKNVKRRLERIKNEIDSACMRIGRDPSTVKILGASKEQRVSVILEAYKAGLRVFGENRVQELIEKREKLPSDIEWHFIGTLQRKKVSKIVPFISCIHSLDSEELAIEINKRAEAAKRIVECLIEINIDKEQSKGGIVPEDLDSFLEFIEPLNWIKIRGLMAIPSPQASRKSAFKRLRLLSETYATRLNVSCIELSMGMSDDFIDAVEEGSTIVRIGGALFGQRV